MQESIARNGDWESNSLSRTGREEEEEQEEFSFLALQEQEMELRGGNVIPGFSPSFIFGTMLEKLRGKEGR